MKNIILLTHGEMSKGVAQSLTFIVGNVDNLKTLSINLDDSIEYSYKLLTGIIESFNNNYPTVIVTDIPGGSTTQIGIKALSEFSNLYLVTGLNMGLVLSLNFVELTDDYDCNLNILSHICDEAKESIRVVSINNDSLDEEGEL